MESKLAEIIEELQKHAKVCETVAEDSMEQARTGESCEKEKNTQLAKEWTIKSKVWLEAEEVVRKILESPTPMELKPDTSAEPPAASN